MLGYLLSYIYGENDVEKTDSGSIQIDEAKDTTAHIDPTHIPEANQHNEITETSTTEIANASRPVEQSVDFSPLLMYYNKPMDNTMLNIFTMIGDITEFINDSKNLSNIDNMVSSIEKYFVDTRMSVVAGYRFYIIMQLLTKCNNKNIYSSLERHECFDEMKYRFHHIPICVVDGHTYIWAENKSYAKSVMANMS